MTPVFFTNMFEQVVELLLCSTDTDRGGIFVQLCTTLPWSKNPSHKFTLSTPNFLGWLVKKGDVPPTFLQDPGSTNTSLSNAESLKFPKKFEQWLRNPVGCWRPSNRQSFRLPETDHVRSSPLMSIRIATKCKAEENTKLLKDWPTEPCAHDALCPAFRQTPSWEKKKCQLILKRHFESTRKNHFERCDDQTTNVKPKTSGSAPVFVGKLLGNRLALLNLAQGTYFNVPTQKVAGSQPDPKRLGHLLTLHPIPDSCCMGAQPLPTIGYLFSEPHRPQSQKFHQKFPKDVVLETSMMQNLFHYLARDVILFIAGPCWKLKVTLWKTSSDRIHAIEQRASSRSWYSEIPWVANMYMLATCTCVCRDIWPVWFFPTGSNLDTCVYCIYIYIGFLKQESAIQPSTPFSLSHKAMYMSHLMASSSAVQKGWSYLVQLSHPAFGLRFHLVAKTEGAAAHLFEFLYSLLGTFYSVQLQRLSWIL